MPIKCRYVQDTDEAKILGTANVMKKVSNTEYICVSPKSDYIGDAKIELSVNNQQWNYIGQKIKFYNGPKITSVSPTYGVTKNPKGLKLTI